MRRSIIVAIDAHNGIGLQGGLPWHLPADLKRFKTLTMGHTILMGRKTYESIGRALPGRNTLVVTRQDGFAAPGCQIVPSIEAGVALAEAGGENELFVIGGGELYRQSLPATERLYLTRVMAHLEADIYFPEIEYAEWKMTAREEHVQDERHAYPFIFETLDRI